MPGLIEFALICGSRKYFSLKYRIKAEFTLFKIYNKRDFSQND